MSRGNHSLALEHRKAIRNASIVFLAPVFILLAIFIAYPILDSFNISLNQWNGITADKTFVGLKNWHDLVLDKSFWISFKNNLFIVFFSIIIQLPIGIALATFLDSGGKWMNPFKVVWFIPLLMSSVAIGFLFKYALATNGGFISSLSKMLGGGNIDLLGNPDLALFTVIGVICWQFIPFYMVYFVACYTSIPMSLFEAATIDGASRGQFFWKIILPLFKPSIRNAAVLSLVGSLKYFDLIYVMTGGGPGTSTELMATYMYKQSFKTYNMGYGATIASGMFILITLMALTSMKLLNRLDEVD